MRIDESRGYMCDITLEDKSGLLTNNQSGLIRSAALEVLRHEKKRASFCAIFVSEDEIREANKTFRDIDSVTDVLSFPTAECGDTPADGYYGDILICVKRAMEQANEYGHSIERELCFLAVHGLLHLFGYDHETKEDEARMREIQATILERMGL